MFGFILSPGGGVEVAVGTRFPPKVFLFVLLFFLPPQKQSSPKFQNSNRIEDAHVNQ